MTATATQPTKEWKNLLGVCACLGEDFGFNPIFLRVAFGVGLIWSPVAVISIYFGLGAIVLLSRLVAPNRRAKPAAIEVASAVEARNENETLKLAA